MHNSGNDPLNALYSASIVDGTMSGYNLLGQTIGQFTMQIAKPV